jgi:hypothetical protein
MLRSHYLFGACAKAAYCSSPYEAKHPCKVEHESNVSAFSRNLHDKYRSASSSSTTSSSLSTTDSIAVSSKKIDDCSYKKNKSKSLNAPSTTDFTRSPSNYNCIASPIYKENEKSDAKFDYKTTTDLLGAKEMDWKISVLDGTSTIELNLSDELGKSKKSHVCLFCGKVYNRKYGLKIHLRTHTGYKPLRCKVCSRPFSDPSNLNKHVRLHSQGETPYRCSYCDKILIRKRDLDRHILSRHTLNPLDSKENSQQNYDD